MAETKTEETTTETTEAETGGLPPEQEERIVDKVVNRIRDVVDSMVDAAKGGTKEAETETTETTETTGTETARTQEINMEALVKAEVAKIVGTGKEADDTVKEVKKELERAPIQMRRDTKFLWGDK